MEQILDQLGSREGLPVDAIRAADANRAMMVPLLLRAIDQVAAASPPMQGALLIAFHLLGQWRENLPIDRSPLSCTGRHKTSNAFLVTPRPKPATGSWLAFSTAILTRFMK